MKYTKIETAGRLVRGVIYTRALPSDSAKARQAKTRCSSAAREAMNLKQSWQKLEVLMAANFVPQDMVLTLTYRDERLPFSKTQAVTRLKKFIRQLRESRAIRNKPTYYIYCTEGYHGNHRWHHHLILNSTGSDYEEIRALWSENGELVIQPQLPPEIRSLSMVVHHRGERFRIAAQGSQAVITKEE